MLPFLRWAGGKRKLAELISNCFPDSFWTSENKFYEPFVGGGAVMLYLGDSKTARYLQGTRLHINDMNPDLICTNQVIQNDVESLINQLKFLSKDLSKNKYYEIREQQNLVGIERAARFIYLNKTGFNGLWRVNSKGHYNVPWGQLKNPKIFEAESLREVSQRLVDTTITNQEYSSAVDSAISNDVVYFDPPYIPLSSSSSFSQYAMADFGLKEQEQLAKTIASLKSKSVDVVLSNSDTELSREIFGNVMNLYQIDASRAIAAKASSRGNVKEIIGTTRKIPDKLLPAEMTPISFC